MKRLAFLCLLAVAALTLVYANEFEEGVSAYENGEYVKAAELYFKACNKEEYAACYNLARMYVKGQGVTPASLKVAALYTRACDGEIMDACAKLGHMYFIGHGVARDDVKAGELYTKACNAKDYMNACYNLAVLYHDGAGVRQDKSRAKELFGRVCDLGNQQGCDVYRVLNEAGVQ